MSQRAGLRAFQQTLRTSQHTFRQNIRNQFQRRWASTTETVDTTGQSGFQKFLNSPVGPRTVHFWAPVMKWGIVIAGISDLARPVEKLSMTQNFALMCTGAIWTRWCLIIKPRNVLLATVNFFLGIVGFAQVTRIFMHNRELKGQTVGEELKEMATQEKDRAKFIASDPKGAAKEAVKSS